MTLRKCGRLEMDPMDAMRGDFQMSRVWSSELPTATKTFRTCATFILRDEKWRGRRMLSAYFSRCVQTRMRLWAKHQHEARFLRLNCRNGQKRNSTKSVRVRQFFLLSFSHSHLNTKWTLLFDSQATESRPFGSLSLSVHSHNDGSHKRF